MVWLRWVILPGYHGATLISPLERHKHTWVDVSCVRIHDSDTAPTTENTFELTRQPRALL